MTSIWTPPSHRFSGLKEARQAVSDYDPNLDFGFNEVTKQWCVFLKMGTMPGSAEADLPILGFDHLPGRDELHRRLYQADALRRGHEIRHEVNRHNDAIKEGYEAKSAEAAGQLAEAMEWGYRKMGSDKAPGTKVFFPEGAK